MICPLFAVLNSSELSSRRVLKDFNNRSRSDNVRIETTGSLIFLNVCYVDHPNIPDVRVMVKDCLISNQ